MTLLIEIQGLRKTFHGRPVLDDVSLRVDRGQTVVLAGPSGSGKTTLLRCLNGLERADAGSLQVAGFQLAGGAPNRDRDLVAIRRRVGFVFQHWHLFNNLTVLGNVIEAPMRVQGRARVDATARARVLLDRLGIAERAAAYPEQLSGGEQQRAAIARALAMEPQVLLLDEPTSALDAARAADVLALLRDLRDGDGGKLTLVVVSHDARVPATLGGRLVVLNAGRVVEDRGSPAVDEACRTFPLPPLAG